MRQVRLWRNLAIVLAVLSAVAGSPPADVAARFFHPLPGACFPAASATTASVSLLSGFFHVWAGARWRLILNAHVSAVGDFSTGTANDGWAYM